MKKNNQKTLAKSLNTAANIDAGTTIEANEYLVREALINGADILSAPDVNSEFALDEGVTDNAPYKDIAEYKMVTYLEGDETKNKKNIQNSQSS